MSTHKYLDTTGLGQVWGKIKDLIPEPDVFWINITSTTVNDVTTYSADKTFAEIDEAITEGKDIKCIYWDNIYNLVYYYDGFFIFTSEIDIHPGEPYSDTDAIVFYDIRIDTSNNTINLFEIRSEIPLPSITTPLMNGTASIGNSKKYAKADHVHPSDTTKASISDVLIKTNTTSYTPSADYNPATKKYVDDATAGITDEKLSTGTIGNDVYYPIVGTNTSSATTKYIDSTGFKYDATSSTNGYARLYLGNGTASGTTGSKYGRLMIYGTTAYGVTLDSGSPTENRTISLPNKNGTIALTSDIQTCATVSEIEEMCDVLGLRSVVIDTSDYEVGE